MLATLLRLCDNVMDDEGWIDILSCYMLFVCHEWCHYRYIIFDVSGVTAIQYCSRTRDAIES